MDYYAIIHPDVSSDLSRMCVREIWYDSYRAYRKESPTEHLSPKEILTKFSRDLYLTGEVGRLWGIDFKQKEQ